MRRIHVKEMDKSADLSHNTRDLDKLPRLIRHSPRSNMYITQI